MLERGFVDEVQRLRQRPALRAEMPSMRCVGYRQAWAALDRGTLHGLRDAGIAATRQLAKRQITWLRSMDVHTRIACDDAAAAQRLQPVVRSLLSTPRK
jgi:tRNA dimethylallyltransferase